MAESPDCVRKIGEEDNGGKFCGSPLKRPKGVTIIAMLTMMSALFGLISVFLIRPMTSMIFGIRVPIPVTVIVILISSCSAIYCGIGLFKLKSVARTLYIWLSIYGMVNFAAARGRIMIASASGDNLPFHAQITSYPTYTITTLIGLSIPVLLIYYIVSRKKFFVN